MASHCNNIGEIHRRAIQESFTSWFGIRATEFSQRRSAGDLVVMTPMVAEQLKPRLPQDLLAAEADVSLAAARQVRDKLSPEESRRRLRSQLTGLLGDVAASPVEILRSDLATLNVADSTVVVERVRLKIERDLFIPLLVLHIKHRTGTRSPAIIGLSRSGKAGFLKHRPTDVAHLLSAGGIVCLPDIRDTGESAADDSRGQFSASTERAASALMVGDPLVAQQLRDARTVWAYLRSRNDVDPSRIAVWGESFSPINAKDVDLRVPRRIEGRPADVEPLGGMLALLLGLYEDEVAAVCVDRGMAEFRGVLEQPFVYVALESVIPGLLLHADLPDLAAALAPRPLMLSRLVDAQNRALPKPAVSRIHERTVKSYDGAKASSRQAISGEASAAKWLVEQLKENR